MTTYICDVPLKRRTIHATSNDGLRVRLPDRLGTLRSVRADTPEIAGSIFLRRALRYAGPLSVSDVAEILKAVRHTA